MKQRRYFPHQAIDGSWHVVYKHGEQMVSVDQFANYEDCKERCASMSIDAIIMRITDTSFQAFLQQPETV